MEKGLDCCCGWKNNFDFYVDGEIMEEMMGFTQLCSQCVGQHIIMKEFLFKMLGLGL